MYKLIVLLFAITFVACSKESIDEIVTDDYIKGEAIVRFELNGVTYGARANDVITTHNPNGSMSIAVNAKDENNDFEQVTLLINISASEKGFYPTDGFMINNELDSHSTALLKYKRYDWTYATFHFTMEETAQNINREGSLTITEVNEFAEQIEGYFSFELAPPDEEAHNLPPDHPDLVIQKIENGYFKYVNIK